MNTLQIVEFKSNVRATTIAGVVVSVVAVKDADGIGFSWYYSAGAADRVMQVEREFDAEYGSEARPVRTTTARFDVEVSSYETADQEIGASIEEFFEQASAVVLH